MTDRASAEGLREAARAMWYAHTEDERFAGPVSADPYGDFERALLAALRSSESDSGIDALRAARREVAHRFDQGPCMGPRQGCAACTIDDALSTPRTETSEP